MRDCDTDTLTDTDIDILTPLMVLMQLLRRDENWTKIIQVGRRRGGDGSGGGGGGVLPNVFFEPFSWLKKKKILLGNWLWYEK